LIFFLLIGWKCLFLPLFTNEAIGGVPFPLLHWDRDTLQHIPILHSQYISWSLLHCVTPHSLALLYETNSYWLIPSRRETGDLLWVGCLFLQLVFLVDDDDKSAHPPDSARPRPARPTRGGYPRHLWPSMAFEGFLGLKTCFLCQLKTKLLQNKTKQTFFFDREREREVRFWLPLFFSSEEKYDLKKSSTSDLNGDAVVAL